jgi:hypothetical protein
MKQEELEEEEGLPQPQEEEEGRLQPQEWEEGRCSPKRGCHNLKRSKRKKTRVC